MSLEDFLISGLPVESFRARCRSASCAATAAAGGGERGRAATPPVAGRALPSDPWEVPPTESRVECPMGVAVLATVPGRGRTGTEAEGRSATAGEGRAALAEEEGRAARQAGLVVAGRRGLAPEETG